MLVRERVALVHSYCHAATRDLHTALIVPVFSYSYVIYFIFYAAMFSYSYVYILHSVTAVYKKCSGRYLMFRLVFMCYYFHLRI